MIKFDHVIYQLYNGSRKTCQGFQVTIAVVKMLPMVPLVMFQILPLGEPRLYPKPALIEEVQEQSMEMFHTEDISKAVVQTNPMS